MSVLNPDPHVGQEAGPAAATRAHPTPGRPVVLEADLAPGLSRGLWLVKWLLALPHVLVLGFLWLAFGFLTLVAGVTVLVTGRYPREIFDFNVGVLRWTWRVQHYAFTGGLGTDTYPPFTLEARPGDAARLDVRYPEDLNRPLVLVKWLLLLPHWVVLAVLAGVAPSRDDHGAREAGWPGVIALLCLAAGIVLLATGAYARALFDVIVGLNRWVYRVIAYGAFLTDAYPPFRYAGGGAEPPEAGPAAAPPG